MSSFYLDLIDFNAENEMANAGELIANQQSRAAELGQIKRCNISWISSDSGGVSPTLWPDMYHL
ncbi:MAG: hypothetical protein AAF213_10510, partial [Pseudomonadota bacterium]